MQGENNKEDKNQGPSYYEPPNDQNSFSSDSAHSLPQSIHLDASNLYLLQSLRQEPDHHADSASQEDYYCMTCNQNYNIKIEPCHHKRNQKQKFKCQYEDCNRSFQAESTFQRHKLIHEGVKPYECDFENCQQRFNQKSNLNRHRRIHTQEKPFICEKCCKSFTTTTNLKQHVQIHFEDKERRKKYVCQIKGCNKEYLYMCNLRKHKQEHQDPVSDFLVEKKPDFPMFSFTIGTCSFRIGYKKSKEHAELLITHEQNQEGVHYNMDIFHRILEEVDKQHKADEFCSTCFEDLNSILRSLLQEVKHPVNVAMQMHQGLNPIANMLVKAISNILSESNLKVFTIIMPSYNVFMDVVQNLLVDIQPKE